MFFYFLFFYHGLDILFNIKNIKTIYDLILNEKHIIS